MARITRYLDFDGKTYEVTAISVAAEDNHDGYDSLMVKRFNERSREYDIRVDYKDDVSSLSQWLSVHDYLDKMESEARAMILLSPTE